MSDTSLDMEDVDRRGDPERPEFWLTSAVTRAIPSEDLEEAFEEISIALMLTPDNAHETRSEIREWVLELANDVPSEMGREGDATKVILGKHIETLLREDKEARQWVKDRRAISRETREWLRENPGPTRKPTQSSTQSSTRGIDLKMISRVSRREDHKKDRTPSANNYTHHQNAHTMKP